MIRGLRKSFESEQRPAERQPPREVRSGGDDDAADARAGSEDAIVWADLLLEVVRLAMLDGIRLAHDLAVKGCFLYGRRLCDTVKSIDAGRCSLDEAESSVLVIHLARGQSPPLPAASSSDCRIRVMSSSAVSRISGGRA